MISLPKTKFSNRITITKADEGLVNTCSTLLIPHGFLDISKNCSWANPGISSGHLFTMEMEQNTAPVFTGYPGRGALNLSILWIAIIPVLEIPYILLAIFHKVF